MAVYRDPRKPLREFIKPQRSLLLLQQEQLRAYPPPHKLPDRPRVMGILLVRFCPGLQVK